MKPKTSKLEKFKKFKDIGGICVLGLIATQVPSHPFISLTVMATVAMNLWSVSGERSQDQDDESLDGNDTDRKPKYKKKRFKR